MEYSLQILLPLATFAADSRLTLSQDIIYQSVGLLVVIGSLSLLAFVISLLGKVFTAPGSPSSSVFGENPTAATTAASHSSETIPPPIQAAIVAAVYATLQQPVEILSVQAAPQPQLAAWSMEGRRQIFLSHKIR